MNNVKRNTFFGSIELNTRDVIAINGYLLVCLAIYFSLYILGINIGYGHTLYELRGIIIYASWSIVIYVVYRYRLKNKSFIGISQENLSNKIKYALAFIFLFMFFKTSIRILFSKSIIELIEKGQSEAISKSLLLFFVHGSLAVLIGPVIEEIIFRGFFYPPLRKRFGVLWGIIFSSAIFALWHSVSSFKGIVNLFVIGVILAYCYENSRSLIPAIIVHSINNLNLQILIAFELLRNNNKLVITHAKLDMIMLTTYLIFSSVLYYSYRKTYGNQND